MTLDELTGSIAFTGEAAAGPALRRWSSLAKPLGSLGLFESAIAKISALTGREDVSLDNAVLLVFCADNGVTARGVSQSDSSVTAAVARALGEGTSTVSYMAAQAGCRVVPVNIGMVEQAPMSGVMNKCVMAGTGDISLGPAMTREECVCAILTGAQLAADARESGANIILLGEMGIGNTTTSAAVACALLNAAPELMTGRGAGLSDAGLRRKRDAVSRALKINNPDKNDPIDILAKVGGLDLAALCGVCLGGAYYKIPILLDGLITCAAALCAVRLCPPVSNALLASHVSEEPAAAMLLDSLGLAAPIHARLRLGEGTGAVLCLSLLRQALAVYMSGHTFENLGIEAYTPK